MQNPSLLYTPHTRTHTWLWSASLSEGRRDCTRSTKWLSIESSCRPTVLLHPDTKQYCQRPSYHVTAMINSHCRRRLDWHPNCELWNTVHNVKQYIACQSVHYGFRFSSAKTPSILKNLRLINCDISYKLHYCSLHWWNLACLSRRSPGLQCIYQYRYWGNCAKHVPVVQCSSIRPRTKYLKNLWTRFSVVGFSKGFGPNSVCILPKRR